MCLPYQSGKQHHLLTEMNPTIKKLCCIGCGLWMSLLILPAHGQTTANTKSFVSRNRFIENIVAQVESLKVENAILTDSLIQIRERANSLEQENIRLSKDNKELEKNLESALNDRLQSAHANSVLFIFIFLVGIILVLALIWMFMRKAPAVVRYQDTRKDMEEDDDDDRPVVNGMDSQLSRIEKLGSLREKGLLTEDEFNMQKKQILGERH